MAPTWDGGVLVIGAGVMGSAAAHSLASSGTSSVALLEQFELGGHRNGSSHGHSRIIRPVYQQEHYGAMMPEAYTSWKALQEVSGETCYTQTGGLYWGKPECVLRDR